MAIEGWREEFRVGVPRLDDAHRAILEAIELLVRGMRQGTAAGVVLEMGRRIAEEIRAHDRDEESWMEEVGYPGFLRHQAIHREIERRTDELVERFSQGRLDVPVHLARLVEESFGDHVAAEDRRFLEWVLRKEG